MGQSLSTHLTSGRRRQQHDSTTTASNQDASTSGTPSRPRFGARRSTRLLMNRFQGLRDRVTRQDSQGVDRNSESTAQDTRGASLSSPTSSASTPSPTNDSAESVVVAATSATDLNTDRRRTTSRHSILGDALPGWRSASRLQRTSNQLRRRRPNSRRGSMDEQIPVLSQLLSAAAAATAASLMGDDPNAVRNARGIGGDEGTLESFLESLQSGRISSALSRTDSGSDENGNRSINFVRLFRFGSASNSNPSSSPSDSQTSGSTSATSDQGTDTLVTGDAPAPGPADEDESSEGRMVPIIIVGIRSIPPSRTGNTDPDDHAAMPAFLDALTAFDDTGSPNELGDTPAPSTGIATPTRFSHHRRRSMGGLGGYDSQRHHQNYQQQSRPALTRLPSPMPRRPFSATSEEANLLSAPPGSRPPPSTPASQGLSAFSSGATTPTHTAASSSNFTNSPSTVSSRRTSFAPGTSIDPLSNIRAAITGAESASPTSVMPSRRIRRNRRNSESDFIFGSGSSRRNGMVEPDDGPSNTDGRDGSSGTPGSRSWIIYVLGGSYPENHPLLNTPSLFTDSPTYEDMLLLSSMLGPAKPPVATEQEVQAASGLFEIKKLEEGNPGQVIAVGVDTNETVSIGLDERCLVCLTEYEVGENARQLVSCGHLFHRECIDTWLTTGRNSCPLCRREGVQKNSSRSTSSPQSPQLSPAGVSASTTEPTPALPTSRSDLESGGL